MSRPLPTESAEFYHYYISLTEGDEAVDLPARYSDRMIEFFTSLPAARGMYSYAPGKWTLHQVIQHLLDVERVFAYRLLWIVRGDPQPLPGFNENDFAQQAPAHHRTLSNLLEEWLPLRASTDRFVAQLTKTELARLGTANGTAVSANALCFILYGHVLHHMHIIETRYLNEVR